MSRRRKTREPREWQEWIDRHRETLKAIGLPPETFLSIDQWHDFLEDGELSPHRYPGQASGYCFKELTPAQWRQLLDFLSTNPEFVPPNAGLPGFLKVRLENT